MAGSHALRNTRGVSFLTLILLIGPALIIFTVFVIVPIFQAAAYSVFRWDGMQPLVNFRGLRNFELILSDPIFTNAILHNVYIVIISILIEIPLALACALAVTKSNFKLAVVFRTIFFLPYVLSEVIAGVLWQFIYHPDYGLIRAISETFFPTAQAPILLGDPNTVLLAIMGVIIWKYFGLHMTILIAGLQDIPLELQEAAKIDGCSGGQIFRNITLPLLRPTILLSVFFSVIGSLQIFDMVWAMGKGDPVNSAETMVTYLYKFGMLRQQIGYGAAVAVIIFLVCLIFSVFYQRMLIREERSRS